MAQERRFVCDRRGHAVQAWSDGDPYYVDESGFKRYAYYPDHEALARCIGNDTPHHCLGCGTRFSVDSRAPVAACPDGGAGEIVPSYHLGGCRCPDCKDGTFGVDDKFFCVL